MRVVSVKCTAGQEQECYTHMSDRLSPSDIIFRIYPEAWKLSSYVHRQQGRSLLHQPPELLRS